MPRIPTPTPEQVEAALEWLRAFEGDPETAEALEAVAAHLEEQLTQRLFRAAVAKIMQENGVSYAQAADMLRRVMAERN